LSGTAMRQECDVDVQDAVAGHLRHGIFCKQCEDFLDYPAGYRTIYTCSLAFANGVYACLQIDLAQNFGSENLAEMVQNLFTLWRDAEIGPGERYHVTLDRRIHARLERLPPVGVMD